MRSPKSFVVSVRCPDGSMALREQPWEVLLAKLKFLRLPFLRGAVVLLESLHNGYSALMFSAEHGLPPEEQGKKPAKPSVTTLLALAALAADGVGDAPPPAGESKAQPGTTWILVLSTAFAMGLFVGLPHLLTLLVGRAFDGGLDTQSFLFHLVDGVFRLAILLAYLVVLSKTDDAKRLFQYHGAEHKAIWTYESEKPLLVEHARPFTTRHPRCGTSFLFVVVGVSVLVHLVLLPWVPRLAENGLLNALLMVFVKIPLAFPIAGIAYEIQRLSAQPSCPRIITWAARPGIWLQGITTQPPDDGQLEVALLSLDRALAREEGHPKGKEGVNLYPSFAAAQAAVAS